MTADDVNEVIEEMEEQFAPVRLCDSCGSPDVRDVLRVMGSVEFVDRKCLDCGYVDVDREGGV